MTLTDPPSPSGVPGAEHAGRERLLAGWPASPAGVADS